MRQPELFRDFNSDRVIQLRNACFGLARAYKSTDMNHEIRDQNPYDIIVAATYFRRAAANSMLIDDYPMARKCFMEASSCYHAVEMPYGILMEAMGTPKVENWPWKDNFKSPQDVYILISMLGSKMSDVPLQMARHQMDDLRDQRISIFAFSVNLYLDLFDAIIDFTLKSSNRDMSRLVHALLPFVHEYSLALERAKRDKFHWERLAMVFHPVEPDIIGLLSMTFAALKQHSNIFYRDVIKSMPISIDAKNVIDHCLYNILGIAAY